MYLFSVGHICFDDTNVKSSWELITKIWTKFEHNISANEK